MVNKKQINQKPKGDIFPKNLFGKEKNKTEEKPSIINEEKNDENNKIPSKIKSTNQIVTKRKLGEHPEYGEFEPLVFLSYTGFEPKNITQSDKQSLGILRSKTSDFKFWSYGIDEGMFSHYYNFFGRNELKNLDIQKAANILIPYIKDAMVEEAINKYYENDYHAQRVFNGRFEHLSFDYANLCDGKGKSLFSRAIEIGDVSFVKLLLSKGAEVTKEDIQNLTSNPNFKDKLDKIKPLLISAMI